MFEQIRPSDIEKRSFGIIGEELSALGFNVDLAPVVDVNSNAANPVIGVRSFSDDPEVVARLGVNYMNGLAEADIAATCKHFRYYSDRKSTRLNSSH